MRRFLLLLENGDAADPAVFLSPGARWQIGDAIVAQDGSRWRIIDRQDPPTELAQADRSFDGVCIVAPLD
jgi:hypothetical protein